MDAEGVFVLAFRPLENIRFGALNDGLLIKTPTGNHREVSMDANSAINEKSAFQWAKAAVEGRVKYNLQKNTRQRAKKASKKPQSGAKVSTPTLREVPKGQKPGPEHEPKKAESFVYDTIIAGAQIVCQNANIETRSDLKALVKELTAIDEAAEIISKSR